MSINLDLELLRTVVAFADTGSFKHAARLVCRSQSAVSMKMKRLEELTGQTLFERKGRNIALTDCGLQLVLKARKLIEAHDRVVAQFRGETIRGQVRIGIPDDYARLVLPRMLHRLTDELPGLALDILADTTPVLERKLDCGELDIAVLATLSPGERDARLVKQAIVWVTSPDHETHTRRPLSLALFSDGSPIYRATLTSLRNFEAETGEAIDFRIAALSKSSAVLTAVAASGFAVTTMAHCVVPDYLRRLGTADGFPDPGYVYLVLRGSPDSTSAVATLLTERIIGRFNDRRCI